MRRIDGRSERYIIVELCAMTYKLLRDMSIHHVEKPFARARLGVRWRLFAELA